MLGNTQEQDFKQFYWTVTGRLSPNTLRAFFLLTLFYSGVMLLVAEFAIGYSRLIDKPSSQYLVDGILISFIVHLFILAFFLYPKFAYKFQRIQAILASIIALKLSVEGYTIIFLVADDRNLASYMYFPLFSAIIIGLIFTITDTLKVVRRIKEGKLRADGEEIFNYKRSKFSIYLRVIIMILIIIGTLIVQLNDPTADRVNMQFYSGFIIMMFLHYTLALGLPEFFIVTYCKFRFTSFIIHAPKLRKKFKKHRTN
jgi:hypothetical protein